MRMFGSLAVYRSYKLSVITSVVLGKITDVGFIDQMNMTNENVWWLIWNNELFIN